MANFREPTEAQVDAVERVLADAANDPVDGYHRALARECCEAMLDAELAEFAAVVHQEFGDRLERARGEGRR